MLALALIMNGVWEARDAVVEVIEDILAGVVDKVVLNFYYRRCLYPRAQPS
jgi:hypothetical protein